MDQVLQACSKSVANLVHICVRCRPLLQNSHTCLEFYKSVIFCFSQVLDARFRSHLCLCSQFLIWLRGLSQSLHSSSSSHDIVNGFIQRDKTPSTSYFQKLPVTPSSFPLPSYHREQSPPHLPPTPVPVLPIHDLQTLCLGVHGLRFLHIGLSPLLVPIPRRFSPILWPTRYKVTAPIIHSLGPVIMLKKLSELRETHLPVFVFVLRHFKEYKRSWRNDSPKG